MRDIDQIKAFLAVIMFMLGIVICLLYVGVM